MTFTDESHLDLVARCLTIAELPRWLAAQPKIDAEFFVWHHTESPTETGWHGKATLIGCFNYFRDVRGFVWAEGPQFWSAPDGVWIGHHPSVPNYVGATNWNDSGSRQVLHMETVHNGDAGPYTADYLMQHARACVAICRWANIPIQWVNIGADGGGLKTREGIVFHRQCYLNGERPKSCPGELVTQTDVWAAIQRAAAEGEDDMSEQAEDLIKHGRVSDVAQSYDLAIAEKKMDAIAAKLGIIFPQAVQDLELQRVAAVAKEKEKLGL